jgi:tRNA G18 (ribose-2'-O)-methylase SpoU
VGPVIPIREPDDERVDDYRNLTDAELRLRSEPAQGLFMVEGVPLLRHLVESSYPVRSMLLTEGKVEELRPELERADCDWPVYVASNEVMRTITGFHFHRGALAVAGRRPAVDWRTIVARQGLIAVGEDIGDHENMGALFRNAAAFGVGAVLLSPGSVDPLYRRAVRVSMGHVLRVPWARITPWPEALEDLKAAGVLVVALTPDPAATELQRLEVAGPVAIVVGAEGPGLSDQALARASRRVRIEMVPGVDSLNVATAAAIAFHALAHRSPPAQPGAGGDGGP